MPNLRDDHLHPVNHLHLVYIIMNISSNNKNKFNENYSFFIDNELVSFNNLFYSIVTEQMYCRH
jgi:hypothetical protein